MNAQELKTLEDSKIDYLVATKVLGWHVDDAGDTWSFADAAGVRWSDGPTFKPTLGLAGYETVLNALTPNQLAACFAETKRERAPREPMFSMLRAGAIRFQPGVPTRRVCEILIEQAADKEKSEDPLTLNEQVARAIGWIDRRGDWVNQDGVLVWNHMRTFRPDSNGWHLGKAIQQLPQQTRSQLLRWIANHDPKWENYAATGRRLLVFDVTNEAVCRQLVWLCDQ